MTIAYFCLSGLDLLGALEDKTTAEQREGWIEWIWSLQARALTCSDSAKLQLEVDFEGPPT